MHHSCHVFASQLSFIHIAAVMYLHRSCHEIALQLSWDNYVPREFLLGAWKIRRQPQKFLHIASNRALLAPPESRIGDNKILTRYNTKYKAPDFDQVPCILNYVLCNFPRKRKPFSPQTEGILPRAEERHSQAERISRKRIKVPGYERRSSARTPCGRLRYRCP